MKRSDPAYKPNKNTLAAIAEAVGWSEARLLKVVRQLDPAFQELNRNLLHCAACADQMRKSRDRFADICEKLTRQLADLQKATYKETGLVKAAEDAATLLKSMLDHDFVHWEGEHGNERYKPSRWASSTYAALNSINKALSLEGKNE